MSSELKTNKISPATGTALTLADSGDTLTLPSGATLSIASGATITNSGTATGFGGDNTPSFRAYLSADQTGTTNAAWNKVNFDTEDWDTDSAYDNSTNYRFTVPSGEGGKYLFSAEIGVGVWSGSDGAGDFGQMGFYVNGALYTKGNGMVRNQVRNSSEDTYFGNTSILDLSAADYVECYVYHNFGSNRRFGADSSFFSGFKLIGV